MSGRITYSQPWSLRKWEFPWVIAIRQSWPLETSLSLTARHLAAWDRELFPGINRNLI
jgi:hypothetical protein